MNMLASQYNQLKRASGPSPEFTNWTENQWFKKLCLVLESQNTIILSLLNENLANRANLQQQQQEITLLREDIRNYKASQDQLQHDLNDLHEENNLRKTDEALKQQEEALSKMTACISTFSAQRSVSQEEQDQQKLLDSVIVSSQDIPVEHEGENCFEIAQDLLKNKLQLSLNKTDVIAAYRVGKKNPSGLNQRKIRLKLSSQFTKSNLVRTAASKRKGLYINECLTRNRQQILYRLRQIRQQNPDAIHQCFVRDGLIKLLNGSSLPSISLCSRSKDVAEVHGVLAAARRRSLTTQDYTQRPLKADSLASIQPNHPSGGRDGIETKARGR
ncbi:uncharacterized protein [Procambarus clarkii]|uniref:uncharacterized protein isoform X2 n=1 Tax=Procambarus clarkii TaxID=6728 RepID=UPI003742914B